MPRATLFSSANMRPNWSETKRPRRPPRPRVWRYRHQRLGVRRTPPPPNLVQMSGVTVRPPLRAVSQNSISKNDRPTPILIGENPLTLLTVPVVDDWRPRPAPRRARRTRGPPRPRPRAGSGRPTYPTSPMPSRASRSRNAATAGPGPMSPATSSCRSSPSGFRSGAARPGAPNTGRHSSSPASC